MATLKPLLSLVPFMDLVLCLMSLLVLLMSNKGDAYFLLLWDVVPTPASRPIFIGVFVALLFSNIRLLLLNNDLLMAGRGVARMYAGILFYGSFVLATVLRYKETGTGMSQLQLGGFMLLAWYFCSQAQQQLTDLADVEDALHQSHGSSDEVSGEHMAQIKEQVVEELVTVKRRRRSGSTSTPSEILVPKKASPARTRSATRKATPKKTARAGNVKQAKAAEELAKMFDETPRLRRRSRRGSVSTTM